MAEQKDKPTPAELLEKLRARDESAFRHVLWLIHTLLKK